MLFSSPTFLVYFLPVVLLLGFVLRRRTELQNVFLLFASLFFYAWGEFDYTVVLLVSMLANYGFGLAVHASRSRAWRRGSLALGIGFNLALLGSFKYANFFADNLNLLFGWTGAEALVLAPVPLPIGISFFTFQAMSYVIDVYRGDAPVERSPLRVGLYIALFPQLIAGPIVRFRAVALQMRERHASAEDLAVGVRRFVVGLGKKVLVADSLAPTADAIFALSSAELSPGAAWLGVLCFGLQIYFDFSGYSDMAIGLGRMFGFHFPENFNAPYTSKSVQEFWRRWHMSLSFWFRDYLYVPLVAGRRSALQGVMALMLVFFLCGLWHGAAWNFVVWGLVHGAFIALERTPFGTFIQGRGLPVARAYTLFVVFVAFVFFRASDLSHATDFLVAMFGSVGEASAAHGLAYFLDGRRLFWLGVGVAFSGRWMPGFRQGLKIVKGGNSDPRFSKIISENSSVGIFN